MSAESSLNWHDVQVPIFKEEANEIADYIKHLDKARLSKYMKLTESLTEKTYMLWQEWDSDKIGVPAIDAFKGDIYSGLQASSLDKTDLMYANEHLFIISGLYGLLRAMDYIYPYRLEMEYKFQSPYASLYRYWGSKIADRIPRHGMIINLTSNEYSKAVIPFLKNIKIINPKFFTKADKFNYRFVAVHAKIARGAYAAWVIKNRISNLEDLVKFRSLGYKYSKELSKETEPVYICKEFKGLGLSVRKKHTSINR